MDPQRLAFIVSLLGIAAFASWLLRLAAAGVARHSAGPSLLRRLAGSRAWPAASDSLLVAWQTALGIELALVGVTEWNAAVVAFGGILALSLLVGRLIDLMRDRFGN